MGRGYVHIANSQETRVATSVGFNDKICSCLRAKGLGVFFTCNWLGRLCSQALLAESLLLYVAISWKSLDNSAHSFEPLFLHP